MKIVEITIKVEVSDEAKFVAVDEDGSVYEYYGETHIHPHVNNWDCFVYECHNMPIQKKIINWKETLTEVPE